MRPRYENEESKKNELAIVKEVCMAWGFIPFKLPHFYQLDFALTDNKRVVRAFVEAKRRFFSFGRHPDVILSVDKVLAGFELSEALVVPFYFAVQFDDCLKVALVTRRHLQSVTIGGRKDRNDADDVELVIHIPNYCFENPWDVKVVK